MLDAIALARRRISFETYIYQKGSVGEQFTLALERAAQRGVQVNLVVDAMGSNRIPGEWTDRLRRRRRARRSLRPAALVHARGAELSHAPQDPRRGWPRRLHRGRRRRRPMARARAGQGSLAGHDGAHRGAARRVSSKARSTRTSSETRRPRRPGRRPGSGIDVGVAGQRDLSLRSSPTGGSNDLKRLYLIAIGAARRTLDIASPYFIIDESLGVVARPGAPTRRSHSLLVEGDLTDAEAGQVREPRRLRCAPGARESRSTSTSPR